MIPFSFKIVSFLSYKRKVRKLKKKPQKFSSTGSETRLSNLPKNTPHWITYQTFKNKSKFVHLFWHYKATDRHTDRHLYRSNLTPLFDSGILIERLLEVITKAILFGKNIGNLHFHDTKQYQTIYFYGCKYDSKFHFKATIFFVTKPFDKIMSFFDLFMKYEWVCLNTELFTFEVKKIHDKSHQ